MWSKKERVAAVSVLASGSLALAKFVVGIFIGSLALISDALHSLIDLGATLVTWFAVRVADRPPDAEHHYGHGKVESVAALAETALLFLLAGGVAVESVQRLISGAGATPTLSVIPFAVLAIEMAVNGWRAHVLRTTARETGSQALEADSLHFSSDMYGSIAVIVGLVLAGFGYQWGDSAAALAVALLIAGLGVRMGRRTIAALIDTAPRGVTERLEGVIARIGGIVRVERLRVRMVGPRYFVDAAIAVPRTLPLDRLAAIKATIQKAVDAMLGDADVTVSTNPVALDDETIQDRIMVIARNRGLAVHHLTVHAIGDKLAVAVDLEVDGALALGKAHEIASALEEAVTAELGAEVEVETHIEPLQAPRLAGRDAEPLRIAKIRESLGEIAADFPHLRNVHDVRVRDTAEGEIVNFHCDTDPDRSVIDVHGVVDDVERALRQRFPTIKRVIGHAEPRHAPGPAVDSSPAKTTLV